MSASNEKVTMSAYSSLWFDMGDLAWERLMLSAAALYLSVPPQLIPALLGSFGPRVLGFCAIPQPSQI